MNTITQITSKEYLTLENLGFKIDEDGNLDELNCTNVLIGETLVTVYTSSCRLCIECPKALIKINKGDATDEEIKFQLGRYI